MTSDERTSVTFSSRDTARMHAQPTGDTSTQRHCTLTRDNASDVERCRLATTLAEDPTMRSCETRI
eukprot:6343010-Pyramimonas_sp.AAC.1